jgi:hypothetical protein
MVVCGCVCMVFADAGENEEAGIVLDGRAEEIEFGRFVADMVVETRACEEEEKAELKETCVPEDSRDMVCDERSGEIGIGERGETDSKDMVVALQVAAKTEYRQR